MKKIQEALLRLDSAIAAAVTYPSGIVRDTQLRIEFTMWKTPVGFAVLMDASYENGRLVLESHLATLAQVYAWVSFQASPMSRSLGLSGESPYRAAGELTRFAEEVKQLPTRHPELLVAPKQLTIPPVFFFEPGTVQATGRVSFGIASLGQRIVDLAISMLSTPLGHRARLSATVGVSRATLEVTMATPTAVRDWLARRGDALAAAASVTGVGDRMFQMVIDNQLIPGVGRYDGGRTQPIGVERANALRRSNGLPPLGDGPIPLSKVDGPTVVYNDGYRTIQPEPDMHVFSDAVVNR